MYCELKRYQDAIAAFKDAIKTDTTYVYAYRNLGNIYRELKQYDNALSDHEKVAELEPDSAYSHTELGLTYALQNQMGKAHLTWQTALPLFEDREIDHLHKALYTLTLGDEISAFQLLDQIFQTNVNPENIDLVLKDVDVLNQCPAQPEGLNDFATKLATKKLELENPTD